MKTILVTGGTGFVGYHVIAAILQSGRGKVRALARKNSNTRLLKTLDVEIVEGDLRDLVSLKRATQNVDELFHVAADYRLWAKNPEELIAANVAGTKNILTAAQESGVHRTVVTSSVSAVARPECARKKRTDYPTRQAWEDALSGNETMDPTVDHLIGVYKKSKFLGELQARQFAAAGMDLVIVNPSTPIGAYDVKPTPTGRIIFDFLRGKMPAYLDTGLNFANVEAVAQGHLLAMDRGKTGERYILGGVNLTLEEFLQRLAKIAKRPAPRIKIPYALAWLCGCISTGIAELTGREPMVALDAVKMAGEIMFYNTQKAVQELGYNPGDLESAIQSAVHYYAHQRNS